jgi:hypothetical protein
MKKMRLFKVVFLLAACGFFNKAFAQDASFMATQYFQDGAPKLATSTAVYEDVDGSPYLYDGWARGEAKLSDGKIYNNLFLKYDQVADVILFKYALTDSAMGFAVPAVAFKFNYISRDISHEVLFLNGFDPIGNASSTSFYQLLSNGKTMLLKRTEKKLLKVSEFNSASAHRIVQESTTYYLAKNKHLTKVNNNAKAVYAALNDKADQLKQYAASNRLDVKEDRDFGRLIDYYNTL